MTLNRRTLATLVFALAALAGLGATPWARAADSAAELDRSANEALQKLYRTNPVAADIGKHARAVLVFPNIIKAGLVFGGSYGEGVLMSGGKVEDYYNSVTGSWGLQAGAQTYGYAVFLMTKDAVDYLNKSRGWEIGVGPAVVLVNEGVAKNLSTSTLKEAAYAFIFDQQGLMASLSIEGTKISRIKR